MAKLISPHRIKSIFLGLLLSVPIACNNNHDEGNKFNCEQCGGQAPAGFALDLSGAASLILVEKSQNSSGSSKTGRVLQVDKVRDGDDSGSDSSDDAGLVKIDSEGDISTALVEALPEGADSQEDLGGMGPAQERPRISAVGFAPTGDVYVLFERSFLYRMVDDPQAKDIWSPSSPYTCQIFRSVNTLDQLSTASLDDTPLTNLECVSNQHEVATWRNGPVMQFDESGNLYFTGHLAGTNNDIFYQYNPISKQLSEKVNANICYHNVEVTARGSVFYTGTSKNNDECSGTSFFRYISSENRLIEISRGWWNFAYESEVDPEHPDSERILFYGPDPDTSTGLPGWDTACLYRYDPSIEDPSERATRIAKCVNNIWGWIDASEFEDSHSQTPSLETRLEKRERCEADGQVFLGGASIDQLGQDSNGRIFLSGQVQRKIGGTHNCSIRVSVDHCSSHDPEHSDETSCHTAGYIWIEVGGWCAVPGGANVTGATDSAENCAANVDPPGTWTPNSYWYNDVQTSACITAQDSEEITEDFDNRGAIHAPGWEVYGSYCQQPSNANGNWTSTIQGFGYVDTESASTDGEHLVRLLSNSDEQVIQFWIIEQDGVEHQFYSSFKTGEYLLNAVVETEVDDEVVISSKTLLQGYEVYNLLADPVDPSRLMFDALYFDTNTYRFGTIDPNLDEAEDVEASFEARDGLTGRVRTMIIVPNF